MSRNIISVEQDGSVYKIVPVDDKYYTVTKNGGQTKRITHDELFINGDIIDIAEWWRIAQ